MNTWNEKGKPRSTVNQSYFENIDCEEKAYWLGFLFADGCIHKSNNRIELQIIDKDHLVKYCKAINHSGKIKEYIYGENSFNPGGKKYRVDFISSIMAKDLSKYGCVPGKSKIMPTPQNIPLEFMRHFIRGYNDGDGSVYFSKGKNNPEVSITGAQNFLEYISEFIPFYKWIGIDKGNTYRLCGGWKTVHWLYHDCTIFMDRKMEKANMEILNIWTKDGRPGRW